MRETSNPLNNIKIASPCEADWENMYGDERTRFCSDCKLNVYNIAEMTRTEAEDLILRSEGRLCLSIYRRKDGTVITRDCPVGWARIKSRVSLVSRAAIGLAGGFIAGLLGLGGLKTLEAFTDYKEPPPAPSTESERPAFGLNRGEVGNMQSVRMSISQTKKRDRKESAAVGRVELASTD
jgi:hypothetical protein